MAELTTDAQALSAASTEFDGIRSFFLFEDSAAESRTGMQDTEKAVGGMFSAPADSSEGATSFDRISSDLKGAIGQVDSTAGDLAGALSGPAGDAASDALSYNFSGIEGAASASVDDGNSFASTGDTDAASLLDEGTHSTGDMDAASLLDEGTQCVQKLAGIWGGSGSESYQAVQQRWDSTAADDAASSLGTSMGFTPPDDGFDFKAMEAGEASCSLKYNFGGIDGAASAVQGTADVFDLKAMEAGEASCSLKYNFGGIDGAASAVQGSYDGDGKDDLATYQPDTHDGGDGGWLFGNGGDGGIPATLAEWALLLA